MSLRLEDFDAVRRRLPDGWEVRLTLTRTAAQVYAVDPAGHLHMAVSKASRVRLLVEEAADLAAAAQKHKRRAAR
jgi:hypothetical protein